MVEQHIEQRINHHLNKQPKTIKHVVGRVYLSKWKHENNTLPSNEEWYTPLVERVIETTNMNKSIATKRAINTFLDSYSHQLKQRHKYKDIRGYEETDTDVEAYYAIVHTVKRWTDPPKHTHNSL